MATYSADEIWDRLDRCKAALIREYGHLGLTAFDFARDTAKVKILVSGVPLAHTGQGSVWRVKDWTGDRAFDGLRNDLEGSNPGVVTAGRPNMLGSVYAMKSGGVTQCGIRFIVERSAAVNDVLRHGKIHLFGRARNVRLWEEHRPAKVCDKCLQIGHFQAVCGFPARCRFCFGDHVLSQHMCRELNCDGQTGFACRHTVRRCLLCDRNDIFVGFSKCPAIKTTNMNSSSVPDGAKTPIVADDTFKVGIND